MSKRRTNQKVTVTIDRPIGYKDAFGNVYPINYGYVAGIIGGDGEEQDAYVLSKTKEPLSHFTGEVIAIIHRKNDVEEKWVVTESDQDYTEKEIYQKVNFIEKYFQVEIQILK